MQASSTIMLKIFLLKVLKFFPLIYFILVSNPTIMLIVVQAHKWVNATLHLSETM